MVVRLPVPDCFLPSTPPIQGRLLGISSLWAALLASPLKGPEKTGLSPVHRELKKEEPFWRKMGPNRASKAPPAWLVAWEVVSNAPALFAAFECL